MGKINTKQRAQQPSRGHGGIPGTSRISKAVPPGSAFVLPTALFLLVLSLVPRLYRLGNFLTTDEHRWMGRARLFLLSLAEFNPSGTLLAGHPGVTTMWAGTMGYVGAYIVNGGDGIRQYLETIPLFPTDPGYAALILPMRLPAVLLSVLFVPVLYLLTRRLLDERIALTAALLVALDPFLVGMGRLLHPDGFQAIFVTLSFLTLLIHLEKDPATTPLRARTGWLLASGGLGGLAFLSKSPSLALIPFVGLMFIAQHSRGRDIKKTIMRTARDSALWGAAAITVFVALWPAAWVALPDVLLTVLSKGMEYVLEVHGYGSFFFGHISSDPGPLYYPIALLLRSTPLELLGLLTSMYLLARRKIDGPAWRVVLSALLFGCIFTMVLSIGHKKWDRYILSIQPLLNVVAAVGLSHLAGLLPSNRRAALSVTVTVVGMPLLALHAPYYITYFNPLLGGTRAASNTLPIGWGEGLELAAEYLNQKPGAEEMTVSSWYGESFAPFFDGHTVFYMESKAGALEGEYTVFYINQLQRQFPDSHILDYFDYCCIVEKRIRLNGVDFVVIRQGPGMQHRADDPVNAVKGVAHLLGYSFPAHPPPHPGGQPRLKASRGETLEVNLYWEILGPVEEGTSVYGYVLAPGGHEVCGATMQVKYPPGPPTGWERGEIIEGEIDLTIPPDTTPGDYTFEVRLLHPSLEDGKHDFILPDDGRIIRMSVFP